MFPQAVVDFYTGNQELLWFTTLFLDLGFTVVLFRLFDIWKPGPIRRLEKLPGGLGIMADDVLAGLFAGVCWGIYWLPLRLVERV